MFAGSTARKGLWLCLAIVLASACEDTTGSHQGPVDTTVPSAGAAISFSELTATGLTVNWGGADDDFTSAKNLSYKLVRAADPSEIDTLEEIDAITSGPGLVQDYTRGLTSKKVAGLTPGTSYFFAVAVRDNTANAALYEPAGVTTLDTAAPEPGSAIGFSDIASTSLKISWGAASDDVTPVEELQYKIVRATQASAIDTLAEVDAITSGAELVQDFTPDITSKLVTGLSTSMAYAFAVVVRDGQGNEALYTPASVVTPDVTPPTVGTPIVFSNVTATGVVVGWGLASDAATSVAGLKYKVVKASDAAAIDTLEECDAITSGDALVKEYTPGVTSVLVTGLASSTSYAFAVVVKDVAGNRALYTPATMSTLDISAPSVGTVLRASAVTATSMNLSWGAATDDVTPQGGLQYKLVRAANAAAIDTLEEVAQISSGSGLVQDFTAGLTTKVASGLSSSTSYAFAVVVRDQQGNQAIYAPLTQSTLDDTTPVPGSALSFQNVATTSLTVSWGKATDNVSSQAELQYKLVRATSAGSIDSLDEVDAITGAPGLVMDYTADVATYNVTGLSSSTSYAFALLVRDRAGNKSLYAPATVTTVDVSGPIRGAAISSTSVTDTQITIVWGAASDDITPAASLMYKVVMGADAAAVDTLAEVDAITAAPGLLADYTANLTTATATSLISSTLYAFAVVVRDEAGNRALYTPFERDTADITPPTTGTPISFNGMTDTSLNVDWGAAVDDITNASDLQYKIVAASSAAAIDTLSEVDAITSGAGLIQDFTGDITTVAVNGLTSSTMYAFAVVVRDEAGNEALYDPDTVSTLDVSVPTPGLALSFSSIAPTSMTVDWGAASDDVTAAGSLAYKLVLAASASDIDSLAEADAITAGPGLVADYTPAMTSFAVSGLSSSTSYAFAVIVRDAAGNKALYAPASQATPP